MWDYTNNSGTYGLRPSNIPAAIAHMNTYHYNAPWASAAVFPRPEAASFDDNDNLTVAPDFSAFDNWVKMWPHARYYMVYAHVGSSFAGASMGTPEFERRLGATMQAWAAHARNIGINPSRIALLLVDEPYTAQHARHILAWARPIKAAAPEFLIFEDICHRTAGAPQEPEIQQLAQICDILCPNLAQYLRGGDALADFYANLAGEGRQLWFYSCSGGPSSKDSIGYYRLQEWHGWEAGAVGTAFWSYADDGRSGNSWNALAAKGEIFAPVYIDSHSVTDGKHWLAIIEGIEDYEYLRMLQSRVDELQAAGNSSKALTRAKKLLADLPRQTIAAVADGDIAACDKARLQVLNALASLRNM